MKMIKITEKYCGRTFNPTLYINVESIKWVRAIPQTNGDLDTYIKLDSFSQSFAINESVDEVLNLINK